MVIYKARLIMKGHMNVCLNYINLIDIPQQCMMNTSNHGKYAKFRFIITLEHTDGYKIEQKRLKEGFKL